MSERGERSGRRWAVVTGASRGIGAAIARRLARDGYAIVLVATDRRTLERAAEGIRGAGGTAEIEVCDLSNRSELDALTRGLARRHPSIHVLVNNAGIAHVGPVAEQGGEHWDDVLELNLRAPFELMRALEPMLRAAEGGAAVVNVGSMGGVMAHGGIASYAAAKAGLHHLTRACSIEWGPYNIRVNAVAPSSTRTDMFEQAHPEERKRALAAAHPLQRVASPDEVGSVVSFLCSADSSFVSGVVLPVDGGLGNRYAIPDIV